MSTPTEWPESLRELIDVIGITAATALVEHWGGVRVWVPVELQPDHPLMLKLGAQAARRLVEHAAGEYLAVPRCVAALRAARDAEIRVRYETETAAALAREYGLTERMIWLIVAAGGDAAAAETGRQPGLF